MMVTNAELAKKAQDQEDENQQLRERLAELEARLGEMASKTDEVTSKVTKKEEQEKLREVSVEDEITIPNLVMHEEPFLKSI